MIVAFKLPGSSLKTLVAIAKGLDLSDLSFTVSKSSISICSLDMAQCMLAEATVPILDGPETATEVGISTKKFNDAADLFVGAAEVKVAIEGHIIALEAGRKKRRIPTEDRRTMAQRPSIPNLDLPCRVEAPKTFIAQSLADISGQGPKHLLLACRGGVLAIRTEGDDGDAYENSIEVQHAADAASRFSPDYLSSLMSMVHSDRVVLHIGDNMPLKAEMALASGVATVVLAPILPPEL